MSWNLHGHVAPFLRWWNLPRMKLEIWYTANWNCSGTLISIIMESTRIRLAYTNNRLLIHLSPIVHAPSSHGQSCLTNLLIAVNTITKAMNEGLGVDLSFLDFSKACDVVNHRIICAKLTALEVSDHQVTRIRCFFTARTFQVRIGNPICKAAIALTIILRHNQ